jgi:hypothetical protein
LSQAQIAEPRFPESSRGVKHFVIPASLSGPSERQSVGARLAREVGASVLAETPRRQLRGQASLLRPAARIKGARRRKSASAEGVGALRGYEGSDGLRSGPNTSGPRFAQTHRVHRFTAAARQIAGKPRSYGLRPESKAFAGKPRKRSAARIKGARHRKSASAEGVGALRGYEGSDGLRSGPNTSGPRFLRHTACAGLLPLRARSRASLAPTACGQNQTLCGKPRKRPAARIKNARRRKSASAEGVGALRGYEGSDGLRSGPNTSGPRFAQTHRVHRFTAAARQIAGKPRSYGLRPESKALRASHANGLRPGSKARDVANPLLPKA